jgi:hypothetical protein
VPATFCQLQRRRKDVDTHDPGIGVRAGEGDGEPAHPRAHVHDPDRPGQLLGQSGDGRSRGLDGRSDRHRHPSDPLQQPDVDLVPAAGPARVLQQLGILGEERLGQAERGAGLRGDRDRSAEQLGADRAQQRVHLGVDAKLLGLDPDQYTERRQCVSGRSQPARDTQDALRHLPSS